MDSIRMAMLVMSAGVLLGTFQESECQSSSNECTVQNCCGSNLEMARWDEHWNELSSGQQTLWGKLGWTEYFWDNDIYDTYNERSKQVVVCWKSLHEIQLDAARSLCYNEEKWNADLLRLHGVNCWTIEKMNAFEERIKNLEAQGCVDIRREKKCGGMKNNGQCQTIWAKKYCRDTCGHCA